MNEREQRDIVDGLRRGQPEAWQRLYDAFAPRIWRGTARLLGEDPADVVQETFLAAARSARTFDPERGTLWMWLWGIARNQAALAIRVRSRSRRRLPVPGAPATVPGDRTADDARDRREMVREALRRLPDRYESVLTGKYLDGLTVEQIAEEMGVSATAASSMLARARRAFRATIARGGATIEELREYTR